MYAMRQTVQHPRKRLIGPCVWGPLLKHGMKQYYYFLTVARYTANAGLKPTQTTHDTTRHRDLDRIASLYCFVNSLLLKVFSIEFTRNPIYVNTTVSRPSRVNTRWINPILEEYFPCNGIEKITKRIIFNIPS